MPPFRSDVATPVSRVARDAALLAAAVFVAAFLGIHTRPPGLSASLWLANAMLLGAFLRWPRTVTVPTIAACFVAYIAADLVSGTDATTTTIFTVANLVGVCGATAVARQRRWCPLELTGSRALGRISTLMVVASVLSTACAVLGTAVHPGVPAVAAVEWFGSEATSYLVILPVVLSRFGPVPRRRQHDRSTRDDAVQFGFPIALTLALMSVGLVIQGPLLLALPIPALLWCATKVPMAGTTALTALWAGWTLIIVGQGGARTAGGITTDAYGGAATTLSVALLALGPLLVAAVSLDRLAVQNKLRDALEFDGLTGTLSRAAFLRRSQQRLDVLSAEDSPVALMMLDLDHFKTINDTLGHAVGDIALVRSAACILGALPHQAIAGRIGGEEFAVLLPLTGHLDARDVADAIRRDHERLHVLSERTTTVSIGIAWTTAAPGSVSRLLVSADHALYDAKRGGRNRIVSVCVD